MAKGIGTIQDGVDGIKMLTREGMPLARNAAKVETGRHIHDVENALSDVSISHPGVTAETKARAGMSAAEIAAPAAKSPGLISKALNVADGIFNIPNLVAMPVAGLFLISAGIEKLGKKTGFKFLEKTGNTLGKPVTAINQPISVVGEKLGIGKPIGKAVQKTTNAVAGVAGGAAEKSGLSGWRIWANNRHAAKHLKKAQKIAGELSENMHHIHADLKPHVEALHGAVLAGKTAELEGHMGKLTEAMETLKKANPTALKNLPKPAQAAFGNVEKLMEKSSAVTRHAALAEGWKNPAAAIKKLPAVAAKTPFGHGMWNASFVGTSAVAEAYVVNDFVHKLHEVKEMYAGMTDQDANKISNAQFVRKAVFGQLPTPVKTEWKKLLKTTGAAGLIQTMMLGFSLQQLISGRFMGGKTMAVQMGLSMGGAPLLMAMAPDSELRTAYSQFSAAHKSGQAIPAEMYAQFLVLASPYFGKIGVKNKVTQAVAEELAAAKASPASIMKAVEDGSLLKFGDKAAATIKASAPVVAATPHVSHVAQLNGIKHARQALGQHTARAAAELATVGSTLKGV